LAVRNVGGEKKRYPSHQQSTENQETQLTSDITIRNEKKTGGTEKKNGRTEGGRSSKKEDGATTIRRKRHLKKRDRSRGDGDREEKQRKGVQGKGPIQKKKEPV